MSRLDSLRKCFVFDGSIHFNDFVILDVSDILTLCCEFKQVPVGLISCNFCCMLCFAFVRYRAAQTLLNVIHLLANMFSKVFFDNLNFKFE